MDNSALPAVREIIGEADFYRADHRAIWRGIERVTHDDQPADVLTVAEALRAAGELEGAGGLVYLQGLASATPSAANVAAYAAIVARTARQRGLAGNFAELHAAALAPGANLDELRADGEKSLAAIPFGTAARTHTWPEPLDLAAIAEVEPAPPESLSEGVPVGYATGTFGHGGIGKSQIELMRAVCIAAGIPYCGFESERRRVLFLSCEDRKNILHWRLTRICRHLGLELASLAGWLDVLDLVGRESILYAPDPRTGNPFTPAFDTLAKRMRDLGTEALFVDGITDTFGGNENARAEVKRYVNALVGLIPEDRGAVILIGHVSKSTANGIGGEGYSGSTAWHNSTRARWYLTAETRSGDEGEQAARTGKLILELQKSNHSEIGTRIEFAWDQDAHLFLGRTVESAPQLDLRDRDYSEQASILRALRACAAKDIPVPAATTGNRTAYRVLDACDDFPDSLRAGRTATRRFWKHIEILRQSGKVATGEHKGADRHRTTTLIVAGNAGNAG
jgi:hypothetical protein